MKLLPGAVHRQFLTCHGQSVSEKYPGIANLLNSDIEKFSLPVTWASSVNTVIMWTYSIPIAAK